MSYIINLHENIKNGIAAYNAIQEKADKEFAEKDYIMWVNILDSNGEWVYYFNRGNDNKAVYDCRKSHIPARKT